jgi:glycosyltransferase involved in cell wall biosynthesis
MQAKPRLAIVLSRFPYPLEKGDKLRAYHQIKQLTSEFDISLLCLHEESISESDRNEVETIVSSVSTYRIAKWTLPFRLLYYSLIKSWPAQVTYFYSPILWKKIQQQLDLINPDIIYNQLPRTIPYTVDRSEPKVVDLMDAFSYGMSKRSISSKRLKKFVYRWESRAIRAYESKYVPNYQGVTMISAQDKVRSPHLKMDTITTVANGVDTDHLSSNHKTRTYDLVFVGNMGYQPNIDAAVYLVNQVLPAYKSTYGESLTVAIAGARPSKEVLNLQSDQVKVSGWVEDINEAYNMGQIFVAPIFYGIGQQNKLMEAIACELPCVVSPEVAAPFNAKHGEELLIAKSVEEFISAIHDIKLKRIDVPLMTNTAKQRINQVHQWKQQTLPLNKLLKDLVRTKSTH